MLFFKLIIYEHLDEYHFFKINNKLDLHNSPDSHRVSLALSWWGGQFRPKMYLILYHLFLSVCQSLWRENWIFNIYIILLRNIEI